MLNFVPTSINYAELALPADQRTARLVIEYKVYTTQRGLYHRECTDRENGIPPIKLTNWDNIKLVDYKIWRNSLAYQQRQRQDLDYFLMNTQKHKCLHVSIDDTDLYLSRDLLECYLSNLTWRGNLHLQIVDRGKRIAVNECSEWEYQYRKVEDFFKHLPLASLDYYQQSMTGCTGQYIDLFGSHSTQQYMHSPAKL